MEELPLLFKALRAAKDDEERERLGRHVLDSLSGNAHDDAVLEAVHTILDREVPDGPMLHFSEPQAYQVRNTLDALRASQDLKLWGRLLVDMPEGEIADALYARSPLRAKPVLFRKMEDDGQVRIWGLFGNHAGEQVKAVINNHYGRHPGAFMVRLVQGKLTHVCLYEAGAGLAA